jgi:hypothetical protein
MRIMHLILTILFICAVFPVNGNNTKTYEGIAERSKAGLVVGGVMITSLTEEEIEKYTGKKLRIRGIVETTHRWRVNEDDPVKKQGFNLPVMFKVISIEVIEN